MRLWIILLVSGIALAQNVGPFWGPETRIGQLDGLNTGHAGQQVAVDGRGRIHVVWTVTRGNGSDVFYSRSSDGGASWTAAREPFDTPSPASAPNIAVGSDDILHLAYNDARDGGRNRVYYSRSADGGDSWEAARAVSDAAALGAHAPSITADDKRRVHVAWHVGDPEVADPPAQVFYARSRDNGLTFEGQRKLNSVTNLHAAWPKLAVEGTNGEFLVAVWQDNRRRPDWDIYIAVSTDGGNTFLERHARVATDREVAPDVKVDGAGTIHLAHTTLPSGGGASRVEYLRSSDRGSTWSPAVILNSGRGDAPGFARTGTPGLIWSHWKEQRGSATDVAARYSLDGGINWSPTEFLTDLGAVEAKFPSMSVGPEGRAWLAWNDGRRGAGQDARSIRGRTHAPVVSVSAASFSPGPVAAGSWVAAFSPFLRPAEGATAGVTVKDSAGVERSGTVAFATQGQLNFLMPAETAVGGSLVTATGPGIALGGHTRVERVVPSLFSANASGQGVAAAIALHVEANGARRSELIFTQEAGSTRRIPVAIEFGAPGNRIFLLLFGTGIRNTRDVKVWVGGVSSEVSFSGPQGEFDGLDQINVLLPRSMAGRGDVEIVLTADDKRANTVSVRVR